MKNLKSLYFLSFILLMVSSCSFWGSSQPRQQYRAPVVMDDHMPIQQQAMQQPVAELEHPSQINARYKIALLVPLTGRSASVGKAISDAAQMAIVESGNPDFQVIPYDTGDNDAAGAADKAIANGANIILGPVFSDKVSKVAAKARQAGIKVITFSNNKAVAGGNVYILGMVPDQQVARVLKYANDRGINGFSGVVPNNVFGNQVAELLQRQVEWFGAELRKISLYSGGAGDYAASAKEVADAYQAKSIVPDRKGEAVMIPEGGAKAISIASALRKAGLSNVRLLGTALWDNETTIKSGSLRGAWFASTPYENSDSFIGRFMTNFNYKPEDIAALGYDAVNLSIAIAPDNFSDSSIRRSRGFTGVKGVYKFDGNNVDIRGYAIYEIRDGAAHVADPAPDHF